MSEAVEWSRWLRDRPLPAEPVALFADAAERAALARRFGLAAIHSLEAQVSLEADGRSVLANGTLNASIEQLCAVSAEPFPAELAVPVALRFVPATQSRPADSDDALDEIELSADDCDEIEYTGDGFDLGEALAQTLGLAIDPYATGPGADAARRKAGIVPDDAPRGSMADALAKLKLG